MISTINELTRVTRKTATVIDHTIKNCFNDTSFETAVFRSDLAIIFRLEFFVTNVENNKNEMTCVYKRIINGKTIIIKSKAL